MEVVGRDDEDVLRTDRANLAARIGPARVALEQDAEVQDLGFEAEGEADSAIANFGANVVGRSAQGVIDRFFERFAGAIGASSQPILKG